MKDLYARLGLSRHETDRQVLQHPPKGTTEEREAGRYVLLHEGRRRIYDRTYETLRDLGAVRAELRLNDAPHWREIGDFRQQRQTGSWIKPILSWMTQYPVITFFALVFASAVVVDHFESSPNPSRQSYSPRQPTTVQPKTDGLEQLKALATEPEFSVQHVTAQALNVRAEPSATSDVIGRLSRYDTVSVRSRDDLLDWAEVEYRGGTGYVSKAYLGPGGGEAAKKEACRAAGVTRPYSGQVLHKMPLRGENSLTVHASRASDVVAKLVDDTGQTITSMYIRAGETGRVATVPDGRFKFVYATGRNYGPACGRFIDDMRAYADNRFHLYQKRSIPDRYYVTTMEYTLHDVVGGNFQPTAIDVADF